MFWTRTKPTPKPRPTLEHNGYRVDHCERPTCHSTRVYRGSELVARFGYACGLCE